MAARRLSLLLLALLGSAQARELPPAAYQQIARQAGIPAEVLYAIALQESALRLRGQLRPWPWTLNVAGRPLRFASQPAACQALHQALATTTPTRIDIGLAQINWGYHSRHFRSPCSALQPTINLTVAAHLLREQHRRSGDWLQAAGHYHRPAGGAPAARYRQGVARHLARLKIALPPRHGGTPMTPARTLAHALLLTLTGGSTLVAAQPVPQRVDIRHDESSMLPVSSPSLSPGEVQPRALELPALTRVFLVGDDPRSLAWLAERVESLRQLGAAGLAVEVADLPALQRIRRAGPGLTILPISGEDIASRLDLRHYPVLIRTDRLEQ